MSRGFRDADATQQVSSRETDDAIKRVQEEAERQAVHAAQLREQGSYGLCEVCGKPIARERLDAVPEATRCVSCQAEWESGKGRD